MSGSLLHIADRVLNRPLLLLPEKAELIVAVLAGRIGIEAPEASLMEGKAPPTAKIPYTVRNGVAVIQIVGSLVNRGAWIGASSGLVSYEGLQYQFKRAAADKDVLAVILDISSPGGEAVGAFETAAVVRELAAQKAVVAVVNGMCCSAAYAIASGATEIITIETAILGSIGVVWLHADFSRQLDSRGVTVDLIHAGAHKVDGNAFQPLTKEVRSDMQAEVNTFYEAFLKTVALGRGARLSVDAARKTEARTYIGAKAVKAGLADAVASFDAVMRALEESVKPMLPAPKIRTRADAYRAVEDHPRLAGNKGLINAVANQLYYDPKAGVDKAIANTMTWFYKR